MHHPMTERDVHLSINQYVQQRQEHQPYLWKWYQSSWYRYRGLSQYDRTSL